MLGGILRANLRQLLQPSKSLKLTKRLKIVQQNRVFSKHYHTLNRAMKRNNIIQSNYHHNIASTQSLPQYYTQKFLNLNESSRHNIHTRSNVNINQQSSNPQSATKSESKLKFTQNKHKSMQSFLFKNSNNLSNNNNNNNILSNAILQNRFFIAPRIDGISFGHDNDPSDHSHDHHSEMDVPNEEILDMDPKNSNGNLKSPNQKASYQESAQVQFDLIFEELGDRFGLQNLCFPKDVMWLAGAPGSGKGEMTQFISDQIGITNPPIMMSEILQGSEIESLKNSGHLVNDRVVLRILFERLLQTQYQTGVIVDGFPRTPVQAECIKLLFDKMLWLRRHFENTEHFYKFRRPVFHVTVLYVEERVSVQRQLERGQKLTEHNRLVEQTGVGTLKPVRHTDLNAKLARERYKNFYNNMYASLQIIKEKFPFHFINAEKSMSEVRASIIDELQYQSGNELADTTFDNVRRIPLASEIKVNARHDLVRRLDSYQREYPALFNKVINAINEEFCTIIKQQALSGQVIIRTQSDIFFENLAINMTLDLLSERGYRVILDYMKSKVPNKIDVNTGQVIEYYTTKTLVFNITFPPPKIRHATQGSTQWETTLI